MTIHIWKRWSNEYLYQLQVRSKWQRPSENLGVGDLVLVKDEHLPPGRWALGKVLEVHPGSDGRVRVVTLKTKKGQLKRPITILAPLPLIDKSSNEELKTKQPANKSEEKTRRARTNKPNVLSLFLFTLLSMIGLAQAAPMTNSYKVTPIENNRPIYFDEAGKLQLIHDEWTLLIYYNLTSYWQATNKINNYINQADMLCQSIVHGFSPCETVISHLRHELRHLDDYNSMLLSEHSRQKRGYFDGIGKLAGTLFGVLDVDFARKYEQDIQTLQTNDNYLLQLMKNQTLIVEAENNIIKRNTKFMNKQLRTIETYMNQTCSAITKIENRAQTLYVINEVNSAAITATLTLRGLQRIQEMLTNALANIYRGHLDTHLFPASQLITQLHIMSGKLPQGLSLPVKDIQKDFRDIYELIHVKARMTNNFLLFELHIPLLSDEDYKIYRVIPIPFQRQGHLKLVQPTANFIAINLVKNSYITMEEQDMHHCTSYGDDEFMCISRKPVYNLQDEDAPCETQVFSQHSSLSCVANDVTCKETWIKLHKPNVWLFTLCDRQLMRVICQDQITPAVIHGTGVIALKAKCILQKKDATIFTYNHLGSTMKTESDIDVPTLNSTINNLFDLNWKNTELNIMDFEESAKINFSKIEEQLTYQKQHEILPLTTDISMHDMYLYSVTSLLLAGIAAYGLYIIIKKRRSSRKPAPPENTEEQIEMREIPISTSPTPRRSGFQFDDLTH